MLPVTRRSVYLSSTESRKPPNTVTLPELRAKAPSDMSKKPDMRRATAPKRKCSNTIHAVEINPQIVPIIVIVLGLIERFHR
jgi:hypothetical protein